MKDIMVENKMIELQNLKKKVKNYFQDFTLNILASIILTGTMQIIVYPLLARTFDAGAYGKILTIMGIINAVSVAFGNSLNNTRLIVNSDYEKRKIQGDFNILLLISSISTAVIVFLISYILLEVNILQSILLAILAVLITVKAYYIVAFRLILNFKKILLCNVLSSVGYLIGCLLMLWCSVWTIPFITAEICAILYILSTSNLVKESLVFTSLFKSSAIKYIILIGTGLSGNLFIYLDRLLLYPILGPESVSVYTTASFFGKTLSIVMLPISSVLLGYFAQKNFIMNLKRFWVFCSTTLFASALFVVISIWISPFITGILYPSLVNDARSYIFLANTAAILATSASMIQPAILKFTPTYMQIVKEGIYGITYLVLGLILVRKYSLLGFCIASLVANIVKIIVLFLIGTIYLKKKKIILN